MAKTRALVLVGGIFIFATRALAPVALASDWLSAQAGAAAAARVTSRISVTLPQESTDLVAEGKPVEGTGTTREFTSAPFARGTTQRLTLTATWQPNTYTTMTRTRTVSFRAGDRVTVDLSADDPTDRVRVIYVPTPSDVADEMVRLAGVGPTDVVFEPGCGDARITIAAVKGGARRGVGIDIDPDRVTESKANVKAAGLDGKIDIRLGDALDIKDLSTATVVFLYMGDHFDMLIRPHLWRELKVGSRIVSHRFTMGDWKPDKTITVTSADGGDYELHLWTITEEVKRRVKAR
jgi:uncharacterized protein (TIGR03000 family)